MTTLQLVLLFSAMGLLAAFSAPFDYTGAGALAKELDPSSIERVNDLVAVALGDADDKINGIGDSQSKAHRYSSARSLVSGLESDEAPVAPTNHQLVYGELSVPVLATVLDAVGVYKGDSFLDIGSGDGGLVLGASLLYPDHLQACCGVELIPGLLERSKKHHSKLQKALSYGCPSLLSAAGKVDFLLGDVYDVQEGDDLASVLCTTTLAVCFATTWSLCNTIENEGANKASLDGRKLPKLSKKASKNDIEIEYKNSTIFSLFFHRFLTQKSLKFQWFFIKNRSSLTS